ncbi:hypothetical protein L7F22_018015 [Adiantum nelumboides]|nr:hypothetical protein [Adiantum nelumboides]
MSAVLAKPQVKDFLKILAKGKEKGQEQRKEHDVNAHAVTAEGEPSKKPWEEDIPELFSPSYSPLTSFSYSSDSSSSSNPRRRMEWARQTEQPIAIMLLDFEKAYDRVDWGFLEGTLHRMGFPDAWIRGISALYRSASAAITIGGHVGRTFTLSRSVNSYPTTVNFTAIGSGGDDFVQAMVGAVESVLQCPIPEDEVKLSMSSKGKYVSVRIGPVAVDSSDQVQAVYRAMKRDNRMKYFL